MQMLHCIKLSKANIQYNRKFKSRRAVYCWEIKTILSLQLTKFWLEMAFLRSLEKEKWDIFIWLFTFCLQFAHFNQGI